ncbi:MAG: nucleotidyltransferase domain-containing protein [Solirubrobacteraceae bacterium]
MGTLQDLASDLGAQERTLRRAVAQGTLRAERSGPRRLALKDGERDYLRAHWPLLADLRRALRTEQRVRLAVLYGSIARGDEDEDSDLDLLVSFAEGRPFSPYPLTSRLRKVCKRRVDIARLERVEASAPLLLERVLDEGRVVIDRDDQWRQLRERGPKIRAQALRTHRKHMAETARAIEDLINDR